MPSPYIGLWISRLKQNHPKAYIKFIKKGWNHCIGWSTVTRGHSSTTTPTSSPCLPAPSLTHKMPDNDNSSYWLSLTITLRIGIYLPCERTLKGRSDRLDRFASGTIGKAQLRTFLAIHFEFFKFDLEFFKFDLEFLKGGQSFNARNTQIYLVTIPMTLEDGRLWNLYLSLTGWYNLTERSF